MSVIFTTCFFDIGTDFTKDKSPDVCFTHFNSLVRSGIRIHLYLSPCFREIYERICGNPSTVTVEYIEKDTLKTFTEVEHITPVLPSIRTEHHDRGPFLTMINAKAELVYMAMQLYPMVQYFAWIDFSIFHVVRHPEETTASLKMFTQLRLKDGIHIPGCWTSQEVPFDRVNWRFCGGFFIGNRSSIEKLHTLYRTHFRDLVESRGLSWEVNVWAYFEQHCGLPVKWYQADHNDSILRMPSNQFYVVASLTSIPSRAESLKLAIDSLLPQVDEIIVSIPHTYRRFSDTWTRPEYLDMEEYAKVKVIRTQDYGPATKYLGALSAENCWVFVCDDDQQYHPSLIERMKMSMNHMAVYQNHYESILEKTSGGCVHGYVGLMIPSSLLQKLPFFPLPPAAYFVDDQWMSIYCLTEKIPILSSRVNEYKDIFKVLDGWHELIGRDALSQLNTRDDRVRDLENFFRVRWNKPIYNYY